MRRTRHGRPRRTTCGPAALLALAALLAAAPAARAERFVAAARPATLEMRPRAAVVGGEVRLRHVARWSTADEAVLGPVADLVLLRLDPPATQAELEFADLRSTLEGAGLSAARVLLGGAVRCEIRRVDALADAAPATRPIGSADASAAASIAPAAGVTPPLPTAPSSPVNGLAAAAPDLAAASLRPVRDLLVEHAAAALGLAASELQVSFRAGDERVLNLSGPSVQVEIESARVRGLGEVAWTLRTTTPAGTQRTIVNATVQAWREQVVAARPIAFRQTIAAGDIEQRRVLVDRLDGEPLRLDQVIGQQASRELSTGSVIGAGMLSAPQLVRPGQLVTVHVAAGDVSVRTVGRALESGTLGGTIRVRSEETRDVFMVHITGPQEGTVLGG